MDTDISNTPSSQQIARTVSQWCRECELSRDWYYSALEADRPITVRINGVPRVIESPSEWRARMENRRSVTTWCKAAGLSRRAYYGLSVRIARTWTGAM